MLSAKLSRLLFAILLVVSCGVSAKDTSAKDLNVSLKLLQIQGIKTSEKMGDELYFSITENSSNSVPILSRMPIFPIYWTSKELPNVKDVTLWSGQLKADDSVLVVLTLMEQDLAPLNPDDQIGSAQVKLTNKNGKLVTKWGKPGFKGQPEVVQVDSKVPKFVMYGDNSKYAIVFKADVETNK